ncbi:hypothetical protein B5S33_g3469 [[Candida] boidinii]|nr:hypothetical protein B5S33_g3469 [[Candida] boidinii]
MSVVNMDSILPFLEGDKIFELDLNNLLTLLSQPSLIKSSDKTQLNSLCGKVNNYLKSNNTRYRWIGTKLVTIICLHPEIIISNHTSIFLVNLIKILETKCFVKDESNIDIHTLVTLKSATNAINFIINKIKGKPSLTREILTPKLPIIISNLINCIHLIPEDSIKLLIKILINNSTTFRPFGNKFEVKLLNLINNDSNFNKFNQSLKDLILLSLVLLKFNLSRENSTSVWRNSINNLLVEIKSTLLIYKSFIDLDNDSELINYLNLLPDIEKATSLNSYKPMFEGLNININENVFDLLKITNRLNVLIHLLIKFIEAPTNNLLVKLPLGSIVIIGEILSNLNLKFQPISKEIRDFEIKNLIEFEIFKLNNLGVELFKNLPKNFNGNLLPFTQIILSSINSIIPTLNSKNNGKLIIDESKIFELKPLILNILECSTIYLNLTKLYNDNNSLNQIIDGSLLLTTTKDLSENTSNNNVSSSSNTSNSSAKRNKGKKLNNNISFSDLLTHKHLFVLNPSVSEISIIRKFLTCVLSNCELNTSKLSSIQRFIILDCVNNLNLLKNGIETEKNKDLIELVIASILFPNNVNSSNSKNSTSNSSVSILPILNKFLDENIVLSIINNPRFPLLARRFNLKEFETTDEQEDNEEDDDEVEEGSNEVPETTTNGASKRSIDEVDSTENELKRRRFENLSNNINNEIVTQSIQISNIGNVETIKVEETVVDATKPNEVLQITEEETISSSADIEPVTTSANPIQSTSISLASQTIEKEESELESDFEIPEIEIDSDDE